MHAELPVITSSDSQEPTAPIIAARVGRNDDIDQTRNLGKREVVPRPTPASQLKDPRTFEITQVERRFRPERKETEDGSILTFTLSPSDQDFPFDLDGLQCSLIVPKHYPDSAARPILRITNQEIPRGFQINIERGFDGLAAQRPPRTLLSVLNGLDRNLEALLTSEKAQTLKFVANAPRRRSNSPIADVAPGAERHEPQAKSKIKVPVYSAGQKAEAEAKRAADIRQLEARLRNVPSFAKSPDGNSFTVPLTIPKAARLPVSLQPLKEVTILIPAQYPLEPCTIRLKGIHGPEAENVVDAFEKHARADSELTLMAHINHLSQNLHSMAKVEREEVVLEAKQVASPTTETIQENADPICRNTQGFQVDANKPHILVIPRPPEWDQGPDDSDDESSAEETDDSSDSDDEAEDEGGAELPESNRTSAPSGNSILLSFPDLELYGIELLEVAALSLTVRCDRCKTIVDVKNLKAQVGDTTTTVSESCPKCSVTVSASFMSEPLHANSIKAGHLDLHGCTVADMLPSAFKPTCSNCSTTFAMPPGVISVRGEAAFSVCRSCHQKMTFKIPEAKFLRVSSAVAASLPLRSKKKKENLGITSGTPLPNFGKCSHYRKSRRWFRFSCCNRVFPCDRCHDEQVDPKHPNEHANRMICGFCSREQNYRPEDCGICRESLVGRKGGGFWEGGKGTRDRAKMSRKDPRKYKFKRGKREGVDKSKA